VQDRNLCTGTVQLSDVIVVFFPEFGTAFLQGNTLTNLMSVYAIATELLPLNRI